VRAKLLWLTVTLLAASMVFSAALWVHRESVLTAACDGVGSAVGQIQFAGHLLEQDPSAAGQREAAYVVAQAVGQLLEAAPVVAQEGYAEISVTSFSLGLQAFEGRLQDGRESRKLVERQAKALAGLGPGISRTFRTDAFSALGRDLLEKLPTVTRAFKAAGVF